MLRLLNILKFLNILLVLPHHRLRRLLNLLNRFDLPQQFEFVLLKLRGTLVELNFIPDQLVVPFHRYRFQRLLSKVFMPLFVRVFICFCFLLEWLCRSCWLTRSSSCWAESLRGSWRRRLSTNSSTERRRLCLRCWRAGCTCEERRLGFLLRISWSRSRLSWFHSSSK